MTIENEYARIIFEKIFNPSVFPKDYPVKNGKFVTDYGGETLEVTVRRNEYSLPTEEPKTTNPCMLPLYMIMNVEKTDPPHKFWKRSKLATVGNLQEIQQHLASLDEKTRQPLRVIKLEVIDPVED